INSIKNSLQDLQILICSFTNETKLNTDESEDKQNLNTDTIITALQEFITNAIHTNNNHNNNPDNNHDITFNQVVKSISNVQDDIMSVVTTQSELHTNVASIITQQSTEFGKIEQYLVEIKTLLTSRADRNVNNNDN